MDCPTNLPVTGAGVGWLVGIAAGLIGLGVVALRLARAGRPGGGPPRAVPDGPRGVHCGAPPDADADAHGDPDSDPDHHDDHRHRRGDAHAAAGRGPVRPRLDTRWLTTTVNRCSPGG